MQVPRDLQNRRRPSGKARRARADHDDVVKAVAVDRFHQSDAACELGITRVTEELPAGTKYDWQLFLRDLKRSTSVCAQLSLAGSRLR